MCCSTICRGRSNSFAAANCVRSASPWQKRWPALPDIPTIAETVPGYEASIWYGISAPKGTPADIVAILNKSVAPGLADPKVKAKLAELGGIPMPMSPAAFGKLVADETEKWAKVVKFANISVD